jgi:hypothetical protein
MQLMSLYSLAGQFTSDAVKANHNDTKKLGEIRFLEEGGWTHFTFDVIYQKASSLKVRLQAWSVTTLLLVF